MRTLLALLLLALPGCALFSTGIRDCASLCMGGRVDQYNELDGECTSG